MDFNYRIREGGRCPRVPESTGQEWGNCGWRRQLLHNWSPSVPLFPRAGCWRTCPLLFTLFPCLLKEIPAQNTTLLTQNDILIGRYFAGRHEPDISSCFARSSSRAYKATSTYFDLNNGRILHFKVLAFSSTKIQIFRYKHCIKPTQNIIWSSASKYPNETSLIFLKNPFWRFNPMSLSISNKYQPLRNPHRENWLWQESLKRSKTTDKSLMRNKIYTQS